MQKSLDQMNVLVHRAMSNQPTSSARPGCASYALSLPANATRTSSRASVTRAARSRRVVLGLAGEAGVAEYLTGTWHSEHLFNLKMSLEHYDHLDAQISTYEAELLREIKALEPPLRAEGQVPTHSTKAKQAAIRRRGEQPLREELWRFAGVDLTCIDGISAPAAMIILTEIGLDLSAFPSEKHFVAWLRLAPRLAISGGRPIKNRPNGPGANRIAGVLRMAAMSMVRSHSALGAGYRRIAFRKGAKVALFAIARRLAILIYRLLRYGQKYVDIGEKLYEERFHERRLRSLRASAKNLGFALRPLEHAA